MTSRLVATAVLVSLCTYVVAGQQPPQPTFRSQVDLVEIDAMVTDARGNLVTDLTADDFEVLEDGKPQTIAAVSLVHIPIETIERPLFASQPIEPDVRTNQGEGRVYLIALDEVAADQALRTRAFLRRFIEQHFGANDTAAVVWVGRGRAGDTQDFTSNRRLLLSAIDRFQGGFASEGAPAAGPGGPPTLPGATISEASLSSRSRMRSLRSLTEFMASLRGRRKAMLYVSTGLSFDMYDVTDYNGGVMSIAVEDAHAAMTAATRGSLTIYAIDPRGLSPDGALGDSEVALAVEQRAALRDSRRELRTFAELTGGFAFTDQNNFDAAFTRIVQENSTYYVVGYYPANERRDGRYRKLQVRVKRPGLQVRARAGYIAPVGRAPAAIEAKSPSTLAPAVAEALRSPLDNPGVPMRVFAAPYRGADRTADIALVVEIDTSTFNLVEKNGVFTGEIELASSAVSAAGKVHPGDRHKASLTLKPDTYDRVSRGGLRMVTEFALPPGRYQLRVAAGNLAGKAGSVMYDLEVPDFTKAPLTMSGVSLTSRSAMDVFTQRIKNPLGDVLTGPITAAREFASGDTLTLFAEVYENLRRPASHSLDMKAVLRADDGRIIRTVAEQRSSTELQGKATGFGFTAELSLDDVAPGLYVIHVEAQANISDRPVASRDVLIRVR